MAFVNLFPLGIVQLYYAVDIGYWYARSLTFLNLPWVNVLEWARLPRDALFIIGGALLLVRLCSQALRYPDPRRIEAESKLPRTLYTYESEQGLRFLYLQNHPRRVFDQFLDVIQKSYCFTAINDAMVIRQGNVHHRSDDHAAIPGNGTLLNRMHA
jgi:hypothetical protein